MGFDDAADGLYVLAPEEFVARRDAEARQLSSAGDREAAAAIRRLRRPSPAAWLVNLLVREHPRQIEELIGLRADFASAQRAKAARDVRAVSADRRGLVARLVAEADAIARRYGHSMGADVQRQVEQTLEAAVADDDSAAAVRGGRLVGALSHVGFGGDTDPGAETTGGGGRARAGEAARNAKRLASSTRARARLDQRKAALALAEERSSEAERARRQAAQQLAAADRELERARRELERARSAVDGAQGTLESES